MEEKLKLGLDNVYESYLSKIKLGEFKPNNGVLRFERRYEELKRDLIIESEKHLHSDNEEVFNYIISLVDKFKNLCYD